MKVTIRQIVLAIPALAKLSASNLKIRTAYNLKQSVTVLQEEADFFTAERRKIIDKYTKVNEDGATVLNPEKEQEAAAELEELLDMVVTPNAKVVKIALDEDLALSVNDMELLEPFVKFTDTEETS